MTKNNEEPLGNLTLKVAWGILVCYILAHLLPYLSRYSLPHYDYGNVMHVINYLRYPELFGEDELTKVFSNFSVITAPIYYLGLAYPLSFMLSSKWVLFSLGLVSAGGCAYFAGGRWTTRKNLVVATLILFVLLHTNVSPLEGNRRSFTAFFLLATFWIEDRSSYLLEVIAIALAAGIYPPAALILVTYYVLRGLRVTLEKPSSISQVCIRLAGHGITFLLGVSPYLYERLLAEGSSSVSKLTIPIVYHLDSISGFINTFIVDNAEKLFTRGPLFRDQIHFDFLLIFLTLFVIERIILGKKFHLRERYLLLAAASLVLWFLAHLTHPLIYHPFKYTRLSLPLTLAFPVFENLPPAASRLRRQFSDMEGLRLILVLLGILMLGIWGIVALYPERFAFMNPAGLLSPTWWKFVFALPVFLVVLIILPNTWKNPEFRGLVAALLLLVLVVIPHKINTVNFDGLQLNDLNGLYQHLKTTPPGTKVSGPPVFFMDFIPAFARRSVYSSSALSPVKSVCERNQRFWSIYFSSSPEEIRNFMVEEKINYLLVDRKTVRNKVPYGILRCDISVNPADAPYLNRSFPGATWQLGTRLYLIERSNLNDNPTSEKPESP